MQNTYLKEITQHNWKWFLVWGIILVILGFAAISMTVFTTLLSIIFLGFFFLICGIVLIIDTFQVWWRNWNAFFPHLLMALLYTVLGLMLLSGPIPGAISLTVLLAVFFIIVGIFRTAYSLILKFPGWKWSLFNGLISLILGILIMAELPASGLYIIGLFVGIHLFFTGWASIMMSLFVKSSLRP